MRLNIPGFNLPFLSLLRPAPLVQARGGDGPSPRSPGETAFWSEWACPSGVAQVSNPWHYPHLKWRTLRFSNTRVHSSSSDRPQGPLPKPRRGGLFIGTETPPDSSFCFSAARKCSKRTHQNAGNDGSLGQDIALVAPPKN